MPTVNNMAELESIVRKRIEAALSRKIAPIIKQEIQKSVDDTVYAAGTPSSYRRRVDNNGLHDERNLVTEMGPYCVRVHDDASASGKNFDPLDERIEYGYGSQDEWYNKPRPFIDNAQMNVNRRVDEIKQIIHDSLVGR